MGSGRLPQPWVQDEAGIENRWKIDVVTLCAIKILNTDYLDPKL